MDKKEMIKRLRRLEGENKNLGTEIKIALDILAELDEKPELRHGDFGTNKEGDLRLIVKKDGELIVSGCCKVGCCVETLDEIQKKGFIFGNIFDLMEDWGEDLKNFTINCTDGKKMDRKFYAQIESDIIALEVGRYVVWPTLAETEEIWRKLGQLIMTLKRKGNKC